MDKRMDSSVMKRRYIQAIQALYFFSVAFIPLYYGGERILAWGVSGVLQSIIAIALAAIKYPPRQVTRIENGLTHVGLTCLGLVLTWALLQLTPILPDTLGNPVWAMFSGAIGDHVPVLIAISPDEGTLTFIKILIVVLAFFNAQKLYSFNLNAYHLLLVIAGSGLFYALLGLLFLRAFPHDHIWLSRSLYEKSLVSTFVNRNSFAQYLGISSLCTLAYLIHIWKAKSVHIRSFFRLQFYLRDTFNIFAFSALLFCILLIGLLLTTSRAGIYSSFAGYAVFLFATLRTLKDRHFGIGIYFILFLVAGYFIYDGYAGHVGERNLDIAGDYENRFQLYKIVWGLIQTRPLTGYGLGGFEAAFRAYIPIDFDPFGIWHRAHNVYLDAAVALGLPAACIALVTVLIPLFIHIVRLIHYASTFSILAVSLYVLLSIHSLFDFGLQAGANALTAAAILGASLTQPKRRSPVNQ